MLYLGAAERTNHFNTVAPYKKPYTEYSLLIQERKNNTVKFRLAVLNVIILSYTTHSPNTHFLYLGGHLVFSRFSVLLSSCACQ